VVITHGGDKVVGLDGNDFFSYCPKKAVSVASVVGAGDCFCAFFAMSLGHGFKIAEATEIAWNAGALYVQGKMNRPITPAELSPNGIVEPEDLRDRDFKLVFTNGCFDLLHDGHIKTLEFAKEKGQKLVVALNTDASIRRLKGEGRPVMPLEQRMRVMANLKPVDFVVSFDEDTPLEVIKKIRPDVLVKGQDYQLENIVGADIVPEVCRAPIIPGLSSSNFIRRQ
jgi:D-beta-D-heptose 7-phosphate kinase/D-beta-D-heptose 1-phosphate adenosyltransferase